MKLLRLGLILLCAVVWARAADDEDEKKGGQPPTEIPDFSNLDEYIYQPKSTLNFGVRYISGVKTKFWGTGQINSPEALPDPTTANIDRTYHDGRVSPDARAATTDNGDGTSGTSPIPSDGKTNYWTYDSPSQLTTSGFMQFHLYSGQSLDTSVRSQTGRGSLGLEMSVVRDMGTFGKHLSWKLFGGMSMNDIQSATMGNVRASITTVTDTYDLFGQTPPAAPYSSTSTGTTTTQTGTDVNGNAVSQTVDTTTLLGNAPLNRTTTTAVDTTTLIEHWKLHGSYLTFRGGPMLVYDVSDRLHLSVSAGVALLYAGSFYEVNEVLNVPTGGQIIDTLSNTSNHLLPGYYADATVQYDLTERTGFYMGAFMQNAGSYTQTASASGNSAYGDLSGQGNGSFKTNVDFSNQQGLRTGVTFRF